MYAKKFQANKRSGRAFGRPPFKKGGSSGIYKGKRVEGGVAHSTPATHERHRGRGIVGRKSSPSRRGYSERIDFGRFIQKAAASHEMEAPKAAKHAFGDFLIVNELKDAIAAKGYITPTPIQDESIPAVLENKDIVGIANTGTGKTAAFLIPLVNKVLLQPKEQAIIVVPTRELAIQIDEELKGFTRALRNTAKIYSVVCVGGASIGRQMSELRYRNNFIIGTPGRLKDLINRKCIDLSSFKTIVLDEADRMLDMGFINDMRFLMAKMPAERQTLFFSATVSPDIEKLISEFLRLPMRVSVKTRDTSKNVDQDVVKVGSSATKIEVLHDLLIRKEFSKVLIFGRTKHGVERLSKELASRGFKAESIHGGKNHSGRQRSLGSFKENKAQILVATDVAARGLDIPDVSHVINYDIPATYDDYVHRIGRTGRGDKKGIALTFV